jgi:hypothetical protein
VIGNLNATQYFSGNTLQMRTRTKLTGPMAAEFKLRDQIGVNTLLWSPCNVVRGMNIILSIDIVGPARKSGLITYEQYADGLRAPFQLVWKRC